MLLDDKYQCTNGLQKEGDRLVETDEEGKEGLTTSNSGRRGTSA